MAPTITREDLHRELLAATEKANSAQAAAQQNLKNLLELQLQHNAGILPPGGRNRIDSFLKHRRP